jgi:hypothetical protein
LNVILWITKLRMLRLLLFGSGRIGQVLSTICQALAGIAAALPAKLATCLTLCEI